MTLRMCKGRLADLHIIAVSRGGNGVQSVGVGLAVLRVDTFNVDVSISSTLQ